MPFWEARAPPTGGISRESLAAGTVKKLAVTFAGCGSERDAHRQLKHALIHAFASVAGGRRDDRISPEIADRAAGSQHQAAGVRRWVRKVRRVGGIEYLHPELCADSLVEMEGAEQRGVQIDLAGPAQHIEAGCAEANLRNGCVGQRVKPGLPRSHSTEDRDVRFDLVGGLGIAWSIQRSAGTRHRESGSGVAVEQAVNLPAGNQR